MKKVIGNGLVISGISGEIYCSCCGSFGMFVLIWLIIFWNIMVWLYFLIDLCR